MEPSKYDIITIIPAQPGYYILDTIEGDNREPLEFWRVPIIAWRIHSRSLNGFEYSEIQYPIGDEDITELAILRPDGTVFDGDAQHESETDALNSYKARHRARVKDLEERNQG